jgi:hypothetical protein
MDTLVVSIWSSDGCFELVKRRFCQAGLDLWEGFRTLAAKTRTQSAGYLMLVINAGLRQERWCDHSLLQSALAARGSLDARNPGPRLQSVKDAQFDFDYSRRGPWERHAARSVIRLVI